MPTITGASRKQAGKYYDKGGLRFNLRHPDFGLKGDGKIVTDGAITTGTPNFSSATAAFTSADAGKLITIVGAGAAGALLTTTIQTYVSATAVSLAANASTTVSGARTVYGTDDTTAMKAAIDFVLSINGGRLDGPDAIYLISAAIVLPLYTGWRLLGSSRGGSKIIQTADNTPIFKFTKENAHSWEIGDWSFEWSANQPMASTLAVGLYFDFDTHTGAGAYHGKLRNISFDRGYYLARVNPAATNLLWKTKFEKIVIGASVSGGVADLDPVPASGQPHNSFDDVYVRADSIAAASRIFNLSACEGTEMDNIEINKAVNGPVLLRAAGGTTITGGSFKVEGATYKVSGSKLIDYSDSFVSFRRFLAGTVTINPGVGNPVYLFKLTGGADCRIHIGVLDVAGVTLTSGALYVSAGSSQTQPVYIDHVKQLNNASISDIASSTGATGLYVEQWAAPHLSADRGDASVTLAMGDEPIQFFSTTLTANRTVTLPAHIINPTNVFNGARFRIVRDALTPGNFRLSILNFAAAVIAEIPENARGIVEVRYKRLAWSLVDYRLLHPTSVSNDRGDAAATLIVQQSALTQRWLTPLTANRAVTLSASNAKNGDWFHIVRSAAATGAATLDVGSGPLKSLAAGQWCRVEFDGSAWFLAAYGTGV